MYYIDGTGPIRSVVQFDGRLWNISLQEEIQLFKISDCLPEMPLHARSSESFCVTGSNY